LISDAGLNIGVSNAHLTVTADQCWIARAWSRGPCRPRTDRRVRLGYVYIDPDPSRASLSWSPGYTEVRPLASYAALVQRATDRSDPGPQKT